MTDEDLDGIKRKQILELIENSIPSSKQLSDFQLNHLNKLLGISFTDDSDFRDQESLVKEVSQNTLTNYDERNKEQKQKYWHRRMQDAWYWCLLWNFANFMGQLIKLQIEDHKSEEVVKMNIIFMSGTMIVFALLLYTNLKMKDKGRIVNIVWCLNAYIVFRQSFGILDYEETKPHMS